MAKVLIADDDPFLIQIYSTRLVKDGYEVVKCSDGEEALAKVKEEKPDLAILDIMLPKMSGLQVLSELKADSKTGDIPIMIMSNLSGGNEPQKAVDGGAVAFLSKIQYTPSQVVKEVEKYLGLSGEQAKGN